VVFSFESTLLYFFFFVCFCFLSFCIFFRFLSLDKQYIAKMALAEILSLADEMFDFEPIELLPTDDNFNNALKHPGNPSLMIRKMLRKYNMLADFVFSSSARKLTIEETNIQIFWRFLEHMGDLSMMSPDHWPSLKLKKRSRRRGVCHFRSMKGKSTSSLLETHSDAPSDSCVLHDSKGHHTYTVDYNTCSDTDRSDVISNVGPDTTSTSDSDSVSDIVSHRTSIDDNGGDQTDTAPGYDGDDEDNGDEEDEDSDWDVEGDNSYHAIEEESEDEEEEEEEEEDGYWALNRGIAEDGPIHDTTPQTHYHVFPMAKLHKFPLVSPTIVFKTNPFEDLSIL
jgi:hypothetical protein